MDRQEGTYTQRFQHRLYHDGLCVVLSYQECTTSGEQSQEQLSSNYIGRRTENQTQ